MRVWVPYTGLENSLVSGAGARRAYCANAEVDEGARDWLAETTRLGAARAYCAGVADIVLAWTLAPAARAVASVANRSGRAAPDAQRMRACVDLSVDLWQCRWRQGVGLESHNPG